MFRRPKRELVIDGEFLYHIFFGLFCVLGLAFHPFFYSILVSLSHQQYMSCKTPGLRATLIMKQPDLHAFIPFSLPQGKYVWLSPTELSLFFLLFLVLFQKLKTRAHTLKFFST
jgi:hypothetical protein